MKEIAATLLLIFMLSASGNSESIPTQAQPIQDFSLIERNGREVTRKDLEGKIWLVNFVFTRCSGPCPLMTQKMGELQRTLPKEIHLLTITVDPDFDVSEILSRYADRAGADPARWWFLTGEKNKVYDLVRNGFFAAVERNKGSENAGDSITHSLLFVLLDERAHVRAFYHSDDPKSLAKIPKDVRLLVSEAQGPFLSKAPAINAILNAASAFFLLAGLFFIRNKMVLQHKVSMGLAFAASSLFLASYVIYHLQAGSIPFQGQGWARKAYFTILLTHSVLAVAVVPLALATFWRAFKGNFEAHKKIARWTFPIWLYVSVTGIVIYQMLYRM